MHTGRGYVDNKSNFEPSVHGQKNDDHYKEIKKRYDNLSKKGDFSNSKYFESKSIRTEKPPKSSLGYPVDNFKKIE